MKRRKVLSGKQLGVRPPIYQTITMWLLLDRLNANQLAWGIIGTVFVFLWIVVIIGLFTQDAVEIDELKVSNEYSK